MLAGNALSPQTPQRLDIEETRARPNVSAPQPVAPTTTREKPVERADRTPQETAPRSPLNDPEARKALLVSVLDQVEKSSVEQAQKAESAQSTADALNDLVPALYEARASLASNGEQETAESGETGADAERSEPNAANGSGNGQPVSERLAGLQRDVANLIGRQAQQQDAAARETQALADDNEAAAAEASDQAEEADAAAEGPSGADALVPFVNAEFDLVSFRGIDVAIEETRLAARAAESLASETAPASGSDRDEFRLVSALIGARAEPGIADDAAAAETASQARTSLSRLSLPLTQGVEQQLRGY